MMPSNYLKDSCVVSCVMQDDQISRRLVRRVDIEMVGHQYVFENDALVHQISQTSIHSLSSCTDTAFHLCLDCMTMMRVCGK